MILVTIVTRDIVTITLHYICRVAGPSLNTW